MWTVQVRDLPQCNHIQKTLHLLVGMPYLMDGKDQAGPRQQIGTYGILLSLVIPQKWLCIRPKTLTLLSKRQMKQQEKL